MREGLRSGKVVVKSTDCEVARKKPVAKAKQTAAEEDRAVSGSVGEKASNLVVIPEEKSSELKDEKKSAGLEEGFQGGTEEEGSVKVGSADIARKRKCVDGDEERTGNRGDVGKKKAKRKGSSDLKVIQVFRRVLRSSAARSEGCVRTEGDEVLAVIDKDVDAEQKQVVEANEKSDSLVSGGGESTELNRKRGRPALEENGEGDMELEKPVVSLERPPKVEEVEDCDILELDGELRKKKKDGHGSPQKQECDLSKSDVELTTKKKDGRGRPRKYPVVDGAVKEDSDLSKLNGRFGKKKDGRGRPRKYPVIDGALKEDSDLSKLNGRFGKKKDGRGRPQQYPVIDGSVKEDSNLLKLDGRFGKRKDGRGRPRKYPVIDGAAKLDPGIQRKTQEGNRDLKVERRGRPRKVQQSIRGIRFGRACKVENKVFKSLMSDGRPKNKLKSNNASHLKISEYSNEGIVNKGDVDQKVERVLKLRDDDEAGLGTRDNVSSSENMCTIMDTLRLKNKRKGISGKCLDSGKGEGERARSELKQSVRDKLVKILLSAGWSIQLRPRQNKDYLDSVYVSLSGRTHWSVTLAYRMLKQHYENGTGESLYYKPGFQFTSLPDNEIEVLQKVMGKRRSGKKTPNTMEDDESENTARSMNKRRQKQKLLGKPKRGRPFLSEQGKSASNRDRSQKKMQNDKRRTLLVRKAMEEADSVAGGYIPYAGKRTVLAWMIDLGTVSLNSKVRYINQSTPGVSLEGRITRDGILCDCCTQTVTISEFEIHSGSDLREPFKNICLESGIPLSQCLLDSWNMQPETDRHGFHHIDIDGDDPNDDTCGICGDGGDLICCDGCPSTFHQSCLDIQKFPSGRWQCAYCSCKFCKMVGGHECQQHDNDNLATSQLYTCQLCEEKYHPLCGSVKVSVEYSNGSSFCGKKCEELYEKMKNLLGTKHDLEEGFSWTLIHRSDVGSSTSVSDESQKYNVAKQIESNSKLAVALLVMDECFLPMVDIRSGINLIRNIVYNFGSNFERLNYSGFLTVILQRGDEVVAAATIRIHGYELAEMPFIGTRYIYRRQGMCRRLVSAIESILYSLGVKRLVIPAISELKQTWTSVFGFMPLEVSVKETIKDMNLLVFPGVQMLQKTVLKSHTPEENLIALEGPRPTDLKEQHEEEIIFEDANSDFPIEAVEPSLSLSNGSSHNADRTSLVDLNMADHSLGDDGETIVKPAPIVCSSSPKQREDIPSHQKASFGSAMVLGIESNEYRISDHEATENGGTLRCSSRNDDNGDGKAKDYIVVTDYSSNGVRNSEAPKKAGSYESEVSFEKMVCRDSVAQNPVVPHHLGAREMHSDRATTVQTSLSLGGIYSTSENCSKDSPSYHLIRPISEEKPEDVGCRVNGGATHDEPVSAPVKSNADDPSREAYLERNGHCKSKEVMSDSLGVVLEPSTIELSHSHGEH